jgi:hypothetical protein
VENRGLRSNTPTFHPVATQPKNAGFVEKESSRRRNDAMISGYCVLFNRFNDLVASKQVQATQQM